MRKRREIEGLEHSATRIEFPKGDHNFDRFTSVLREVIDDNCGYSVSKTLEYCEIEQEYFVTVVASGRPAGVLGEEGPNHQFNMRLERSLTIDPKQPIAPQIEHIMAVQQQLKDDHGLITTLLQLRRQGYKMVNLDD